MVADSEIRLLPPIVPTERGALAETVYGLLRGAILDGALTPGTRIVEEALARQVKVSRAPLRQAIWLLKRDGLLIDESARSTRVVTLSADSVRELHLIRTVLETVAYQHAARHISTADIADLRRIIAQMQRAAVADDRRMVSNLDYEFHQRLCEVSGLPRLVEMWEQQHILFRLWLNIVSPTLDERVDHIAETHQVILDSVLGGNDDEIFVQVLEHVYFVGAAMRTERTRWAADQPRITSPVPTVAPASQGPRAARQVRS